ncbi:glycosyltransferase [Sphingobacterium yanglingense]|uniref:Glycosyltransferase involved in cell wall biosynthesis n=1 Tax=Sphingobacterium yanglingense TaxID=1437280 RepID=A0A4R6WPE4_9SPHI|nr:glycosyltransferase [Sphingobacterium yanglingense]TDQ80021.1 glycosyltransferase involved in cell wall biosynthesis [Sphingobacterium yanglingense]
MTPKKNRVVAFLSTFPPRACGIATYTTDLMQAIDDKFDASYELLAIPIENDDRHYSYPFEAWYRLKLWQVGSFECLSKMLNTSSNIDVLCIQHEFGLFEKKETAFLSFLARLNVTIVITFHTVLPHPEKWFAEKVSMIADKCEKIIVMTQNAADILKDDYRIEAHKIRVIPHGTHLAPASNKPALLDELALTERKVLSTFGLLGPGKSIETTLLALPSIIEKTPNVIFLIIGVTHPNLILQEGEAYRDMLKGMVKKQDMGEYVRFVDKFLSTEELIDYLLVTDVYLFTSNNPLQAVSGTFAYALSSGCPIVSTPIPHVLEVLDKDMGIIIDFAAPDQLADAVNEILADESRLDRIRHVNLQKTLPTSWQNSAIAHVNLFEELLGEKMTGLVYSLPKINLSHVYRMTTDRGFIQFAQGSRPDIGSGYTLDDNARALIAMLHHYQKYPKEQNLSYIEKYLDFIAYCMLRNGTFLNYVDKEGVFTSQNRDENLEDANGRAIWALGEIIGMSGILPKSLVEKATSLINQASENLLQYHSTRAMAFIIKGLGLLKEDSHQKMIETLADRLCAMFEHESTPNWQWYESYLTYANSVIPEALLCAYLKTGRAIYKVVAYRSFDFLLSRIMINGKIHVVSNQGWIRRGQRSNEPQGGEQPIDVAYTIIALDSFYKESQDIIYKQFLIQAFEWFLGRNHLGQIMYNPVTGGCFDGLEKETININQGAESTLSYLLARLTREEYTAMPSTKTVL